MSIQEFLIIWGISFAVIQICRVAPVFTLRGRALSPRVTEALGYIPPAAFAALVANDLLSPTMFANGIWAGFMPIVASAIVVVVAYKTRSMLGCCVVGVVAYILLGLL